MVLLGIFNLRINPHFGGEGIPRRCWSPEVSLKAVSPVQYWGSFLSTQECLVLCWLCVRACVRTCVSVRACVRENGGNLPGGSSARIPCHSVKVQDNFLRDPQSSRWLSLFTLSFPTASLPLGSSVTLAVGSESGCILISAKVEELGMVVRILLGANVVAKQANPPTHKHWRPTWVLVCVLTAALTI